MEIIHRVIEWIALGIDLLAVAVIASAVVILAIRRGTVRYLFRLAEDGAYESYRRQLARPLILALDLLIAGDIVKTTALEPTPPNVAALGLLVLVRTLLAWSLELEIEGRWPWQRKTGTGASSTASRVIDARDRAEEKPDGSH